MGYSTTTIIGNLGRNPEMKTAQSGTSYCKFSVAVTEKYNGNETTDWYNCTAFGKTAEICSQYLSKGSQVYIEGKVTARAYMPKEGSEPKASLELVVNKIVFIGSKAQREEQKAETEHMTQKQAYAEYKAHCAADEQARQTDHMQTQDDDIPF